MLRDDQAQEEVSQWIQQDNRRRAATTGAPEDHALELRIRHRLDEIRNDYDSFLLRHPEHARAYLAYGSFLNDLGEDHAAREKWEKARELAPENPATWNNLANYYGHRGPSEKAFQYYEKAIELNPKEPVYYWNLATTVYLFRPAAREYYSITEPEVFERSLKLYLKALELDPDNFVLATDYAMSYYGIRPSRDLPEEEQKRQLSKTNARALTAWTNAMNIAKTPVEREGVHIHLARIKINEAEYAQAQQHLNLVTNALYQTLRQRLERNLKDKREGEVRAQ